MRKFPAPTMLLLVCGCQPSVKVPTAQELVGDPQLLADWQARCDTGEYSHLSGTEYSKMCSSTHDASMTVTQMQAGKKDSDFFGNMSKRK